MNESENASHEEQAPLDSSPTGSTTEPVVPQSASGLVSSLLYGLSLPERVVRGAVGLTAGAARELAGLIVPQAFQDSSAYRIAVRNSLGFLTETVGGVPKQQPLEADGQQPVVTEEEGDEIARRAVGNFVDLAGLATLHVSPLWVMAIVSDVCYGSKSYVQELASELVKQGVISESSTIHHVDDILDAVQRATGTAVSAFDKPPFSIDELRQTISNTRDTLSEADVRKLLPESELRDLWSEMRQVAEEENVSLLGVSGAIAMQTLNRVKTVGHGTLIGLHVAGGLLNRNVISHYTSSLERIQQQGFYNTLQDAYRPYVEAVWENFSQEKKSWTESLLDGSTLGGWFNTATGWINRDQS